MKKLIKFLALTESLLLLSSSFMSCSNESNTEKPDETQGILNIEQIPETEETSDERMIPGLDIIDQDGMTFHIYGNPPNNGGDWLVHDMVAEGIDGTTINDSIYERNMFLEETYNFDIQVTTGSDMQAEIANLVNSGDETYSVFGASALNSTASARNGYFYNLNSISTIDLTRPHWDESLNAPLTIEGRAFMATGDITIVPKEGVRVFYFNKELREILNLESPYDLVNSGKWTLDKMFDMMQGAASDLDGDGKINNNDRYALQGQRALPLLFYLGANETFVSKDENDCLIFNAGNERSMNVMMHISELFSQNEDGVLITGDWQGMLKRFESKQVLFYTDAALHIETMRSYEVEFGILPAPKYEEIQDSYINFIDHFCNIFYSIPSSSNNPENIGYLLEVISAASKYYLTPAYYDVCLKGKYARDEESIEMLDIIFDTYRLELADVYRLSVYDQALEMMGSGNNYFSSLLSAHKNAVPKTLEKIHNNYRSTEAFNY